MTAATYSPPRRTTRAVILLISMLASAATHSQALDPLPDEVRTIADSSVAAPVEHTFDVSVAGTYELTLTDIGLAQTPSNPMTSMKLAITHNDAVVGTPLSAVGAVQFSATPGTYGIHLIGVPSSSSGLVGVTVKNVGDGSQLVGFADIVALPPKAIPQTETVLDDRFTVATSGNYQVSLGDLQFPQSLGLLTLVLVPEGGANVVAILPDPGNGNAMQATVSLTTGVTYRVFAVGQTSANATAGLYNALVTSSQDGSTAYGKVVPVGAATTLGSFALSAGSTTLTLTDLSFPTALTALDAVLVSNGQPAVQVVGAGSKVFTATAGTYFAFAIGVAGAGAPGAGSYAVQVVPAGGAAALSLARGVTAQGSALSAYSFDTGPLAAGAYKVTLTDFQLPAALTAVNLAAVQAGAVLGTPMQAAGSADVTAAAGAMSLVAFAQAPASGGLLGVDVMPSAGGDAVFDQTQGVGALFSTLKVSVTSAGNYAVTANDLQFPAAFANFATVVTQGTQRIGSVYGKGSFAFMANPGNYYINFIAQTNATDKAGTYALNMVSAPLPVVTLQSDVTHVASGGTAHLTWTSQNATTCTASDGWSGTKDINGSATTAALTATTTYTLTCTGLGGSSGPKSISVSVDAPAKGGGGGGSLGLAFSLALFLIFLIRVLWLHLRSLPHKNPRIEMYDTCDASRKGLTNSTHVLAGA